MDRFCKNLFSTAPLLGLSAMLLFPTPDAFAQTIVQNHTISSEVLGGPIDGVLGDPEGTYLPIDNKVLTLPFQRFDTALGTLNSVEWDYSFSFESTGTINSNAPEEGGPAGGGGLGASVSGSFFLDPLREGSFSSNGVSGDAGPAFIQFDIFDTQTLEVLSIGAENFGFFSAPGGGKHQIEWVWGEAGLSAIGDISDVTFTLTGGHSNLTFNYTPVPEPTSLALLGVGAVGLMARRRRTHG